MKYLSPAERRAFQDIQEHSESAVSDLIREGVKDLRDAMPEVGHRGAFTRQTGFTAGREAQRIASLPPEVFYNLERVDPEIVRDKVKFYAWLNQYGQEYDTRRKVD